MHHQVCVVDVEALYPCTINHMQILILNFQLTDELSYYYIMLLINVLNLTM